MRPADAALAVATPTDREIVMTRRFDAPRELVWEAWTRPEHVREWTAGPDGWSVPVCEIDLRPGGTHRSVWRGPDGAEMEIRGVYREIEPPARLVYTDSWKEGLETLDTLELEDDDGGTRIRLTMRYPSREARDAALESGMSGSMERGFARLDAFVESLA